MGTIFKDIETNENNMARVILLISVLVIIITYELFYSIWEHFSWFIYLLDNYFHQKSPQKAKFHYSNSLSLKKSLNLVAKQLQSCKDCRETKSGYIKTNNVCYTYITNEFLMVYLTIKLFLSSGQLKEHPKIACLFFRFLLITSKFKDLCTSY